MGGLGDAVLGQVTVRRGEQRRDVEFDVLRFERCQFLAELEDVVRGPEVRDPRETLAHVCSQVESQLVEQEDEGLCLEARLLLFVPRNNGNALV